MQPSPLSNSKTFHTPKEVQPPLAVTPTPSPDNREPTSCLWTWLFRPFLLNGISHRAALSVQFGVSHPASWEQGPSTPWEASAPPPLRPSAPPRWAGTVFIHPCVVDAGVAATTRLREGCRCEQGRAGFCGFTCTVSSKVDTQEWDCSPSVEKSPPGHY